MKWLRWLFSERATYFRYEHSGTLNLIRFLFCLATAVTVVGYAGQYDWFHRHAPYYPVPLFAKFSSEPLPLEAFQALRWCLVGALLLASLALATRPLLVLSAALFFLYEGTNLGFTKPRGSDYAYHMTNLAPFFLLLMAAAPGIDRHGLLSTLRRKNVPALIPEWPRKAMIGMVALAYFGAGYCRVMASPLWADGYTLQSYLLDKAIRWDIDLGFWLAQHWLACVAFSVMTMALELGYVLVLFWTRVKPFFIAGGLAMHVGILLAMNINFLPFFGYNYFAFLEWPWLVRVFGRAKPLLDSAVPGPPLPRAQIATCLLFIGIQAGCVFGRVESWPFSDFRVFQQRRRPESINVLYLAKAGDPANPEWVPFWENYFLQRAISYEPSKAILAAELARGPERAALLDDARQAIYRAIVETDPEVWRRNGPLMLMTKRPRLDEATGRWTIVVERAFDLPPPRGSE